MKLTNLAFGFLFATGSLLGAACGGDDDDDNNDVPVADARPIDAAVVVDGPSADAQPDAPRVVDFGADEGGEVRLEYIRFPPNMTQPAPSAARGTAFFYKDSGATKFWPFLSLDGCTDLSGPNGNGKWPKAQNATGRQYYDVGPYVNVSGGPSPFVIKKTDATTNPQPASGKDPIGRMQTVGSWYFDPATNQDTDGLTYLPADTFYDVTLPGSGTYAGKTYDNAVYMPADWSPVSPAFNATPIPMTAGTEQNYVFGAATNHPPAGATMNALIAFTGANGPAVICIKPVAATGTTTVTVPAAMVDIARTAYPTGGQVARQTVAHVVKELVDDTSAPTGRRIDFLGVWCYAGQGMLVQ